MAIKISGSTIIDDSRVLVNTGNVGVGTTNPTSEVVAGNSSVVHAGIVTANYYYGDGSNLSGIGGGGAAITVLTSNTTLEASSVYMINASSAITLTLPASPSTGDAIDILNNTTLSHTVARNGSTIQGLSEDLVINESGVKFKIWYTGSTWSLF